MITLGDGRILKVVSKKPLTAFQRELLGYMVRSIDFGNPNRDEGGLIYAEMSYGEIASVLDAEIEDVEQLAIDSARAYHSIVLEFTGKDSGESEFINLLHKTSPCSRDQLLRIRLHPDVEAILQAWLSTNEDCAKTLDVRIGKGGGSTLASFLVPEI